jgi:predicted CxxxxCH...CXXCH cytochrome family protein
MDDPRSRAPVVLVAILAATSACAGTLEDPARFLAAGGDAGLGEQSQPPTGSDGSVGGNCPDIPGLFAQTCTASSCHSASYKAQGLDLQSPNLGTRLAGVAATEVAGSGLLINPTAPSQSVLYEKLTANPPYGGRMPLAGTPLDDATMACVLTWITQQASSGAGSGEAGAPEDSGAVDAASE